MSTIQSIGVGSGVLTSDLVDQLVEVERAPTEARLDFKQEELEAELSAFGMIKNAVTDLRLPMRILSNPASVNEKSITSSSSTITAVANSESPTGTYALQVDQLALSHSLVSPASASFASPDDVVGTGTMTFLFGETSYDPDTDSYTGFMPNADAAIKMLSIDSSNNTLEGIKKTINEEDFGVQASIINDGVGYRLLLTSEDTGEEMSMQIVVSDNDGDHTDTNGLSSFAFNSSATNMDQTQAGQNAMLQINGITIERDSNKVTEIIDGVTITLSEETSGPVTLTIAQDTEKVLERVTDFIDKYNEVKNLINEYTDYDEVAQQGAILMGDSTLRNVERQLQQLTTAIVPGLENSPIRSLAEVGIETNRENGNLQLSEGKLLDALLDYPDEVSALFSRAGNSSDALVKYNSHDDTTAPGTYDVEITQIATQANFTGTAVTNFTIDANNDEFSIMFEGNATQEYALTLTAGTYTGAQLALEIQTQINTAAGSTKAEVTFDGANIVINQAQYGDRPAIEITAVDTNTAADLGLSIGVGTAGLDVEGTINGAVATGNGQTLTLEEEGNPADGIRIDVVGGVVGPRGTVSVVKGFADQMVAKLNDFLAFNGTFNTKTNTLTEGLDEIQKQRDELDDRIASFRARLEKQFIAADILVSQLNSTRDYVKQQLDSIAQTTTKKDK